MTSNFSTSRRGALKLGLAGDRRTLLVPLVAVCFSIFLLYAAGPQYLLLGCLIYAPGSLLYVRARREQGQRLGRAETLVVAGLWLLAALETVLLVTGTVGA